MILSNHGVIQSGKNDPFSVYQQFTFENQSKEVLLPTFPQFTFENQSKEALLPTFPQFQFENQDKGSL